MRILVRALASVGALTLVALLVAVIAFWSMSVPSDQVSTSPTPNPGGSATTGPAQLGGDDIYADGMGMTADRFVTSAGDVRDVYAVARGLRTTAGKVEATAVGIDATVPFATVERQIGYDVRLAHDGAGQVRAQAPITLLGRTLTVSAVGRVVPQGRDLVIEPVEIDLPGPDALQGALLAVSQRALTLREQVPGLPEGMSISSLAVRDDGFRVHLWGSDVSLSR